MSEFCVGVDPAPEGEDRTAFRILVIGDPALSLGRRLSLLVAHMDAQGLQVEIVCQSPEEAPPRPQITGVWLDEAYVLNEPDLRSLAIKAEPPPVYKLLRERSAYTPHVREASRLHAQRARNALKQGRR